MAKNSIKNVLKRISLQKPIRIIEVMAIILGLWYAYKSLQIAEYEKRQNAINNAWQILSLDCTGNCGKKEALETLVYYKIPLTGIRIKSNDKQRPVYLRDLKLISNGEKINAQGIQFVNADLTFAQFQNIDLTNAQFVHTELSNVALSAYIENTLFEDCYIWDDDWGGEQGLPIVNDDEEFFKPQKPNKDSLDSNWSWTNAYHKIEVRKKINMDKYNKLP